MAAKNCWCVYAWRGLLKKDDVTAKKTWINFDLSVGTKEQNVQKMGFRFAEGASNTNP